ncbi:MAG: hypothetical protein JWO57_3673 [Pseudonocardiales bacterium]|nr:hypothetical protein [Pseudonocardiales bacterium]
MTQVRWIPLGGQVTRQWPRLAAVALLDLVIGVLALAWPGATVLVLALILGAILLVSGLTSIAFGVRLRSAGFGGGWPIGLGAITAIAGIVCLFRPGSGVAAIALVAALWFLLSGATDLARAFSVPDSRLWWGFLGVLSVIAGIVLLVDLGAAILTIAIVVGVSFLLRGVTEMSIALQLRRLQRSARV